MPQALLGQGRAKVIEDTGEPWGQCEQERDMIKLRQKDPSGASVGATLEYRSSQGRQRLETAFRRTLGCQLSLREADTAGGFARSGKRASNWLQVSPRCWPGRRCLVRPHSRIPWAGQAGAAGAVC